MIRKIKRPAELLTPTPAERAVIDQRVLPAQAWPQSEHLLQKHLIDRANLHGTTHPALRRLHAIPNGGGRSKSEAGRLRAEGVRRGVSDLCLPAPNAYSHGLYLELKKRAGTPSPDQWDWLTYFHRAGYTALLCNDPETAWQAILNHLTA